MTPERLYAALLLAYPAEFRRAYRSSMIDAFSQLSRAHGASRAALWSFVIVDLAKSACAAHLDACRAGTRRFALEWAGACACGAVATGLLANGLTWAFSYFYHPFLEGLSLPPWSYGALLGLTLGGVQTLALRKRFRLGATWIVASTAGTAAGLEMAVSMARLAGPFGYGIVLGCIVGVAQWTALSGRSRRSLAWTVSSTFALSTVVLWFAVRLHTTFDGLNAWSRDPLAAQTDAQSAAMRFLVRGLYGPASVAELATELAVMLVCGLVVAAWTITPLAVPHGHQEHA